MLPGGKNLPLEFMKETLSWKQEEEFRQRCRIHGSRLKSGGGLRGLTKQENGLQISHSTTLRKEYDSWDDVGTRAGYVDVAHHGWITICNNGQKLQYPVDFRILNAQRPIYAEA